MKVPLLWFKSESDPWDVMLPTWSYEWLMLNSTSLWERALLTVSIRAGKSPLEKLLKLNSLNPSRLSWYCEESTAYLNTSASHITWASDVWKVFSEKKAVVQHVCIKCQSKNGVTVRLHSTVQKGIFYSFQWDYFDSWQSSNKKNANFVLWTV